MKNGFKFLGIIVLSMIIGFSMMACGDGPSSSGVTVKSTSGSLTISGLSSYNGKYIGGDAGYDEGYDEIELRAFQSINSSGSATGALISNGSATLKVWKLEYTGEYSAIADNYNGNGQDVYFYLSIVSKATPSSESDHIAKGYAIVNFTNGVGTGTFVEDND